MAEPSERHWFQLSLRTLFAWLALAVLTGCSPKSTPVKLSPGARLEIYSIAAAKTPSTIETVDPVHGGPLFLQIPAIITAADIASVHRSEIARKTAGGAPSGRTEIALGIKLTPAGTSKMTGATAMPMGNALAIAINGQVVCTPKIHSPVTDSMQITGIDSHFIEALARP